MQFDRHRRKLLHHGLALPLLLGAGPAACEAGNAATPLPEGDAYEPWRSWNAEQTGSRNLVHAAVLAANAHDTQPWIFCLAGDHVSLFADERRNLGAMDPFRREMHLSLGCALENLLLAARAQGLAPALAIESGALVEPKGDPMPRLVARVHLPPGRPEASPRLAALASRHTDRATYDGERAVNSETVAALTALSDPGSGAQVIFLTDPPARRDFAAATVDATRRLIADATMIGDSDAWFRATTAEIAAHRDGPTIDAAGLSPWMTTLAKILPAPSPERTHAIWLDRTRDVQLATAPLFGMIVVRDLYDREQAIHAGMLWQRLHLQATLLGLAAQPINQLPEMVDRERQLGKAPQTARQLAALSGSSDWHPTFTFRMGWPTRRAPASSRRALDDVIRGSAC